MIAAVISMLVAFQVTPELRQRVDAGLKAKAAGDLEKAAREFKRVTELAPDLAVAHVNLGAVYFERKDYSAAIPALRKALQLNPKLPAAHNMLGVALLAQGYAAESIPHLEQAGSNGLLGIALLDVGRVRESIDRLEAELQKRPGDADLLYYLSQAHGRLSKQLFDQLREQNPESARTQQMMGEASAVAGDREGAAKRLRSALSQRPDLRGVHYLLGEMLLESGDYEKAEREFRLETELAPGSAAAAYKLGLVLLNRGLVKEASVELERANQLRPDMPETMLELGKALAISGESTKAEKLFQAVLLQEKTSRIAEIAHFQLAQIYRKLGRQADADRHMAVFQDLRRMLK